MSTYTYSLSDNKVQMPSQMQLAIAQQEIFKRQEYATMDPDSNASKALREKTQTLTNLLKQDKEKAKIKINELVASAKQMTAELTTSLTAVPLHPYQQLLNQYLGSTFVCPTIHDLEIPMDFSPALCKAKIKKASTKMLEHEITQFQTLTAEVMDTTYEGVKTENLNNAFAVLSCGQYVIDTEKLKRYLTFAETVKSIPIEYITENPIIVAKKLIAEFTSIVAKDIEADTTQLTENEKAPIEAAAKNSAKMLADMLNKYDDATNKETQKTLLEQTQNAREQILSKQGESEYNLAWRL